MQLYFNKLSQPPPPPKQDLDTPSPAFGRAVATAVHQAVTDPYFVPLEKLQWFLSQHPETDEISVDILTKWAPDDQFPTCFVWSRDQKIGGMAIDHAASPWALETVERMILEGLRQPNPKGRMNIGSFEVAGEKYWLGYLRVPLTDPDPRQVGGVVFSIKSYLDKHVPRFINDVTRRARFQIAPFQLDEPPIHGEPDGPISLRILNDRGEVYYQQGRTFEPGQLIYSESKWYPKPIVCMQEGWDLEVYSTQAVVPEQPHSDHGKRVGWMIVEAVVLSLLFWIGMRRR